MVPAASSPIPLPVIVNRSGGTARREGDGLRDTLQAAFAGAGRPILLELVEGKEIDAALDRHKGAPRVAVGGGDGTLGNAAGKLAAWGTEFAVLPLGTRNHFARQLDIPLDLEGAARVAAQGRVEAVDIGAAGDRTFLNNASLGAYVDLVEAREDSALPKAIGSVAAGLRVLRNLRPRGYDLSLDGRATPTRTVQLFIGNNRYEVSEGHAGERPSLQDGMLSVFATAPLSRLGLVRTAFRVALGKPDMKQDFALDETAREVVIAGSGEIGIAVDGETTCLPLPLTLRIRPRALKVVVPSA